MVELMVQFIWDRTQWDRQRQGLHYNLSGGRRFSECCCSERSRYCLARPTLVLNITEVFIQRPENKKIEENKNVYLFFSKGTIPRPHRPTKNIPICVNPWLIFFVSSCLSAQPKIQSNAQGVEKKCSKSAGFC